MSTGTKVLLGVTGLIVVSSFLGALVGTVIAHLVAQFMVSYLGI